MKHLHGHIDTASNLNNKSKIEFNFICPFVWIDCLNVVKNLFEVMN
jgi:hypothetical protein